MRRSVVSVIAVVLAVIGGVVAVGLGASAAPKPTATRPQADTVDFSLGFVDEVGGGIGDVVYCGVASGSEPYELDVVVSNPPQVGEGALLGYEAAGWLSVMLQGRETLGGPFDGTRRPELNVPGNGSLAFQLTLGGRPGVDQLVQIDTQALGDEYYHGAGSAMYGYASVLAQPDAVDPFEGDGRTDNFCLTIGIVPDAEHHPGGSNEFMEGTISTTLAVPDAWVLDGDGSDGGLLVGFPH